MEIYKSSFKIPSDGYNKQISNANISLRINAGYLPITEALKSFISYDKVAIITCNSIETTAAENLGKKLKTEFGEKTLALYTTDYVKCKDTARFINKGWNGVESPNIDTTKNIINDTYFGLSGSWTNIVTNARTDNIKKKAENWKSSFINEMPSGLSWWVSRDTLLVPLIYNLGNFNPEKYQQLYKLNNLPWISPLTGIIIAIKGNDTYIDVVTGLNTGFISSDDTSHDYSNDDSTINKLGDLVATTFTHPNVTSQFKSKPDISYIFDKSSTNSNPLYCDSAYAGCGQCVACQNCDSGCQTSCQGCDGCNACQTCFSCQSKCQNGEYSWTLYKEKITQCSSCVECNICVNRYTKSYVTACNPCNSCYTTEQVATWSECSGCQWGCTSCTSCNGCNDNSVAACVPFFYNIGISMICSPCVSCHASCTSCNSCNGSCDSCNNCYRQNYDTPSCSYYYSCNTCTDGCTTDCHGCTGKCYGCNGCTSCTGCQNCTGCQAACTGNCQGGCYGGCISCNSKTTPTGYKCDGCTNEQPITSCVPNCETGCYKGCTADNSYRYKRYNCNNLCMTCVGIDEYACTSCYQKNYDVEFK